ncbi:MAG: hypothetical protein ACI4UE_06130 [Candidatus Scatovivens sp.]
MLVEKEIKKLVDKKEYNKIFNYFHEEYTTILKNFLIRHEVKIKDEDCLINYIVKTRVFMPQYSKYTFFITNAMYNEDFSEEMKYELLISSYNKVKDVFSK